MYLSAFLLVAYGRRTLDPVALKSEEKALG